MSEDLDDMISNPAHEAEMVGTVLAPTLSPASLTITEGRFNLFTVDANNVDTHNMRYRMKMVTEDGRTLLLRRLQADASRQRLRVVACDLDSLHHDL